MEKKQTKQRKTTTTTTQNSAGVQTQILKKFKPSKTTKKYNKTLKAPPMLVCTENTALGGGGSRGKYSTRGGVSQGTYNTRLHLVVCKPLNMPSRAVFSVHTCGSALTITYCMTFEVHATGTWNSYTYKEP